MTTHLHPDGLPITDTPICDAWSHIIAGIGWYLARGEAKLLEHRARKAEAQLAVAMKFMDWIVDPELRGWTDEIEFAKGLLAEIKAIGGGE